MGQKPAGPSRPAARETVKTLSELTSAVKDALSADRPHLIEIGQRRITDS